MIARRAFIGGAFAAAITSLPSCVSAPAVKRLPRVGYLAGFHDPATDPLIDAFQQGLNDLGYVDGRTMQYTLRYAEGSLQRFDEYALEFVHMPVDVMASSNADALRSMRTATTTIPIVMANSKDPVEAGWVQSLARPGGNITGMGSVTANTTTKLVELLKEAFPTVLRIAAVWDGQPDSLPSLSAAEEAARALRTEIVKLEVGAESAAAALTRALQMATARAVDGLIVLPSAIHLVMLRREIVGYAASRRIPAAYPALGGFLEAGGLLAYGEDFLATFRRAASFVDRILKGADPAEMPIEQPKKFDLMVNLKTATELGSTVPQSVLSRATRVIR